tara:strand:+ start:1918 stop:2718 length:801 start_codon:yes stop_codon:yes gene_type:complete
MKEIMEKWRQVLREAKEEDERKRLLGVEVESEEDEFEVGDEVSISVEDDEEENEDLEEWDKEKDYNYPSRKKRRRERGILKPDRGSYHAGYDDLKSLSKGRIGLDSVRLEEEKKKRKPACYAYQGNHGMDGKFVNPYDEKGSYSMKKPDSDSPDDCDWGKASRKSANRSHSWVKQPCGRGAKYRCKDGSAKWEENLSILEEYVNDALDEGIDQSQLEAYLSGIISRELSRAVKQHMAKTGCSFNSILRGIQAIADAEKGSPKKESS